MPPKSSDAYDHGQMMGMLVIIMLLENARDQGVGVKGEVFDRIKSIAVNDLAEYLNKPTEDVYLMVEQKLKEVK